MWKISAIISKENHKNSHMGIAQHILKDSYLKIGDEVHKTLQCANLGK